MMKKISFFIILSLLGLSLISSHLFAATRGIRVVSKHGQSLYLYKDYHALVVGVSDYEKWPDLPNAIKDAEEVSRILKRLGFTVELVSNPNSTELKKALNDMAYRYGREENRALLFYYAGHGETEILADRTKLGYIIPRDCPLLRDDPQGFVNRAISMKDIEAYSLRIRSKHVLMLFDSCFAGSLFSLVRAVPEDITEKSSLPVRQYITAGTEDETVPDRSMFKRCLLLGLEGDADLTRDGYITGTELGLYLSDKVVQSTSRAQHPQYGKIRTPELARGDFIFHLGKVQAVEPPSSPSSLEAGRQRVAEERERLEREKRELEQLKLEIETKKLEAERKRLEAEKQKLEMAKLPPWKVGEKLLVNWSHDKYWYPATIKKKDGQRYFVVFDDGDKEWTVPSHMIEEDIRVGDRVFGNWKKRKRYYPGRVTRRDGNKIHISYDDGDQENTTISFVRVLRPRVK